MGRVVTGARLMSSFRELSVAQERSTIDVEHLQLNVDGSLFFGKDKLRLHKLHKHKAVSRFDGFIALAPDNEILLSKSHRILSFQSHPEISSELPLRLLERA
ncbi:hypothetical protein LMH87_009588 [Akanthomyces muscarius]|uniref:Glutamine amidotransferase domain-containing protein n=1 Tax=Akanthomyces muscarius TaxID=2231603 RepID=A0A9W8QDT8_AKAMU|nr:hypothetical protein LMH87_009588 [Akanthomyces muscarius]KAJ4153083.1 hypothetical protein LMH87_009588 [Akanthomyces muscarius]